MTLPGHLHFPATIAKAHWMPTTVRRYYLHFSDDTYGIMTLRINSGTHEIHGKIRRNPKAGERDLTGVYSGDFPTGSDYD